MPTIISTSTHLLLAKSFYVSVAVGSTTFFQAFSISSSDTHCSTSSTPLNLSHSGLMPGIYAGNALLLRDAVLDLTTQDVLIAIQVRAFQPPTSYLSRHGVLRLSDVLASNSRGVGTITLQLLNSFGPPLILLRLSFNGAGRVFHFHQTADCSTVISALEYNLYPGGHGEQASKVTKYTWILLLPSRRWISDYDSYSGRVCVQSWRAGL